MDKLIHLIQKIQHDIGLSFSLSLQGNWVHGEKRANEYPLKLKETYGFLSFSSPPPDDVLSLLKLLLEKEINEYMELFSLEKISAAYILGETPGLSTLEELKKTLPKGKLFLVESKQIQENKLLLKEAFENEVYYLWTIEERLLLFLNGSNEEEISQSIYASILENTLEEPLVAYMNQDVLFEHLPKAYLQLKDLLLTGKTYFKEKHLFSHKNLLFEKFLYSLPKEDKEETISPYMDALKALDLEDKTMIYYYVKNHMTLQKTAKDLHLHRNTLTYRLGKLEKDFNLDLKNMTQVIFLYTMILFVNELS